MVNLVEVKLGQCAWKAPKKAGPPKETEKPESDWYQIIFNPFTTKIEILILLTNCFGISQFNSGNLVGHPDYTEIDDI